jgi:phosphate transport system substrate-binding protein
MKLAGRLFGVALIGALCQIGNPQAFAAEITGAGSTFVYPILSKWSAEYNAKTGVKVNYQSIGSGGGIAQIKAATVDFGASDMPMKPDELRSLNMGQFPLVIGGVVPVVNIEGVKPGDIKFTGAVLADIYLGARLRNRWSRRFAKHCVPDEWYGHEVTLWLWPA